MQAGEAVMDRADNAIGRHKHCDKRMHVDQEASERTCETANHKGNGGPVSNRSTDPQQIEIMISDRCHRQRSRRKRISLAAPPTWSSYLF